MMKKQVNKFGALLTVEEMADSLGIKENQAYRLIHRKALQVLRLGPNIRVPKVKLLQWIEHNTSDRESI